MRWFVAITILLPASLIDAAEVTPIEFVVVSQTVSAKRLDRSETGNLYPWLTAKGGSEFYVSNSCGFADYSYLGFRLREYQSGDTSNSKRVKIDARAQLGEWCRLSGSLFEGLTLLALRHWAEVPYIVGNADIFYRSDHAEYIVDPDFIEEFGLTDLLQTIEDPQNSTACVEKDQSGEDYFEWFVTQPNVRQFGEVACYIKGVHVLDIRKAP